MITNISTQTAKFKSPGVFFLSYDQGEKLGGFFELMYFKNQKDNGPRYALAIKMIEKAVKSQ